MRNLRFISTAILALILYVAPARAQQLVVQNEPGKTIVLTRADIEALPHVKVTAPLSNAPATFDAVALSLILEKAGIGLGDTLKGKRLASCLLVEAADGYRAVIALPEIDPAFSDKQIVLAYLKDGKPLDEKEGPYRIVIPGEKRMARWVRQVTTLKIVDVQ
jgi:hypothetical protein